MQEGRKAYFESSSAFAGSEKLKNEALIVELDDSGQEKQRKYIVLPFFPESLADNKAINWSSKEYPGASMPIYQYVSSGDRTIGFDAALIQESRDLLGSAYNIDINDAIHWLRSHLYPAYNSDGTVEAPPVLRVYMGGYEFYWNQIYLDVIMTGCDVTISKWWDGQGDKMPTPKSAMVSLSFTEIANFGNKVILPEAGDVLGNRVVRPVRLGSTATTFGSAKPIIT